MKISTIYYGYKMEKTKELKVKHYTESIYYEIELTARYCRFLGAQLFDKLGIELSTNEYSALDTISCNSGICQRDLAKLILKDRANTGRILDALEKRKLIERYGDTKNNRLVRMIKITPLGTETLSRITAKFKPAIEKAVDSISEVEIEKMRVSLKNLRDVFSAIVETQI